MDIKSYQLIKDILTLRSNVKIDFQYGRYLEPNNQNSKNPFEIEVLIKNRVLKEENEELGRYSHFTYNYKSGSLYYFRKIAKIPIEASFEGLGTDLPRLIFNKNYKRFIKYRMMNLHSVETIASDVIFFVLLRNDFLPLFCGAFRVGEKNFAVFGPPNVGKTLTTLLTCNNKMGSFISEDISLTDGNLLYGVQETNKFREYGGLRFSKNPGKNSFFEMNRLKKKKKIRDYVSKFEDVAKINKIIILEKGNKKKVEILDKKRAFYKIFNLNNYLFKYRNSPILSAYDFFQDNGVLKKTIKKEHDLMKKFVNNSEEIYLIKSDNSLGFSKLIPF